MESGPITGRSSPWSRHRHLLGFPHELGRDEDPGPQSQDILQPFLADRPVDKAIFSPPEAEVERRGNADFSTRNPPGEHCTPGTYRCAIVRACLKAHPYPDEIKRPVYKLPPEEKAEQKRRRKEHREHCCWHPHQLRHNYATRIRKEFGVEAASNMLDHSSISMTEVYAERNRDQAIEIAQRVG